jgi:hypothetical protein
MKYSVLLFFAFAVAIAPLDATRIQRQTLEQLRENAEAIVVGEVIEASTRLGPEGTMVWTDYTVRIHSTLKGQSPSVTIVSFAGGQAGGVDIGIHGIPTLERGETYVFFLSGKEDAPMPTVGWGQGLYKMTEVVRGEVSETLLISVDGEPLELSASGRLRRGRPVGVRDMAMVALSSAPREGQVRAAEPVVTTVDERVIEQPARHPEAAEDDSLRTFATLSDLRRFIRGELAAEPTRR